MARLLSASLIIGALAAVVVTAHGYDILTVVSSALTSISRLSPGLEPVGAYDNFFHFPAVVRLVLAGCMLFGRLEIFTLLALFSRDFWRRQRAPRRTGRHRPPWRGRRAGRVPSPHPDGLSSVGRCRYPRPATSEWW